MKLEGADGRTGAEALRGEAIEVPRADVGSARRRASSSSTT